MNFKFYDILAHLIPGFIFISIFLFLKEFSFDNNYILPATAAAFLIGYFVNTLSGWMQGFYYWTWKGNPGEGILAGKKCWNATLSNHDRRKAIELLSHEIIEKEDYKTMFAIAKRKAESNDPSQRLQTFNTNYAFSRVILTTIILLAPVSISIYSTNWISYIICAILLVMAWYRAKQRAYYYAREVINIYVTAEESIKG